MPQFDLRHIMCAKYVNTGGAITYTNAQAVGDAMTAQLELRYAEGRLYAESSLAEFMKKCTGGTISLGVKYIKTAAQQLLFGSKAKTRSVTYQEGTTQITAAAGKKITVVELDANNRIVSAGVVVSVPKT